MSFTLNSITEDLEKAYGFIPFGGENKAYKIQPDDDGLGMLFEFYRDMEHTAYYSGGGRTDFYSSTIDYYSYEHLGFGNPTQGKETPYVPTYIVFTKYDVIFIDRNNKGEKHQRNTIHPSIRDDFDNYKDFEDNHAGAVCDIIQYLSRMNRRRARSALIHHRICLRKKMGLRR